MSRQDRLDDSFDSKLTEFNFSAGGTGGEKST